MLRPSSANVFNSDSLFKALGLLCQINGYAIVFNVSTLFGSEVRLSYVPNGAAQHKLKGDTL
jgi:hypothetical protein